MTLLWLLVGGLAVLRIADAAVNEEAREVKIIKGCGKGRTGVFSDALNCTRYIQCPRFGSKPIPFACFPGFVYNPCQKACTWDPAQKCVPVQSCAQKVGYLFLPSSLENRVGNLIAGPSLNDEPAEDQSVFAMPDDQIEITKESINVPSKMALDLMKQEVVKEEEAIRLNQQARQDPRNATTLEIYIVRVVFGPNHKEQLKLDLPDLQRHLRQQIDRAAAALNQAADAERSAKPIVDIDIEQRPFLPQPALPQANAGGDDFESDEAILPAFKNVEQAPQPAEPTLQLPSIDEEDEVVEHVINLPEESEEAPKDDGLLEGDDQLKPGDALLEAPRPDEIPPFDILEGTKPAVDAIEDIANELASSSSLPTTAETTPVPAEIPLSFTDQPAEGIDALIESNEALLNESIPDLPEGNETLPIQAEIPQTLTSTIPPLADSTALSIEELNEPELALTEAQSLETPESFGTTASPVTAVSIEIGLGGEEEEELGVASNGAEELSLGQPLSKPIEAIVEANGDVSVQVKGPVEEVCGIPGLAGQAVCSCASESQRALLGLSDPELLSAYCATLKCLNDGMFIWNFGECGCLCKPGFRGIGCEDPVPIETEPCGGCLNGGKCVPVKEDAEACQCPIGYIGGRCEYSVQREVDIAGDEEIASADSKTGDLITGEYSAEQLSLRLAVGEGRRCLNGGLSFLQPVTGERRCFCTANYAGQSCGVFCSECAAQDAVSLLGRFN